MSTVPRRCLVVVMAVAVAAGATLPAAGQPSTPAHTGVTAIGFSPDGQHVVTGHKDGTVVLWDAASGQLVKSWRMPTDAGASPDPLAQHPWRDAVWAVHCGKGGKQIQAVTFSGWVQGFLWVENFTTSMNLRTGQRRKVPGAPVYKGTLLPQELYAVSYSTGAGLVAHYGSVVRGHAGSAPKFSFARPAGPATAGREYVLATAGDLVLEGGGETAALLGKQRLELQESGFLQIAALRPDGKSAFGVSRSGAASLWDTQTGMRLRAFGRRAEEVHAAAVSPDGHSIVVVCSPADGVALRIDAATGQEIKRHPVGTFAVADGLPRHARPALASVAFSPDGRHFLTGTVGGRAILWDTINGKAVWTFGAETAAVPVALPVKERRPEPPIWSSTRVVDNKARVEVLLPPGGTVRLDGAPVKAAFEVGPIAAGSVERKTLQVRLGDGRTFERPLALQAGWRVHVPALWPPSTQTPAKKARQAPAEVVVQKGHTGGVTAVAFSADGKLAVSGGTDGSAIVWELDSGRQLRTIKGPGAVGTWRHAQSQKDERLEHAVVGVAFSNGDRDILIAGALGGILRAERVTGVRGPVHKAPPPPAGVKARPEPQAGGIALTPDGAFVHWHLPDYLVVAPATTITRSPLNVVPGSASNNAGVRAVRGEGLLGLRHPIVSANGKAVVHRGQDEWTVWDVTTGARRLALPRRKNTIHAAGLSPDGKRLAVAFDKEVAIFDVNAAEERLRLPFPGGSSDPDTVVFSPEGGRVAIGFRTGALGLWDLAGGKLCYTLPLRAAQVPVSPSLHVPRVSIAFSPDGSRLLTGAISSGPALWDAHSGQRLAVLGDDEQATRVFRDQVIDSVKITALAFSPDGRQLAAGLENGALVWTADGDLRRHLPGASISDVAFSLDGRCLALAHGNSIALYDAHNGLPAQPAPRVLADPGQPGRKIVFHPDGQRLYAGSPQSSSIAPDPAQTKFDVKSLKGRPLGFFRFAGQPVGFLPDGQRLVTILDANGPRLVLWDTSTAQPVWPALLRPQQGLQLMWPLSWAAVMRDGKAILTNAGIVAAETGTVRKEPGDSFWFHRTIWAFHRDTNMVLTSPPGSQRMDQPDSWELLVIGQKGTRVLPHPVPVTAAAFRADGRILATGGKDGIVRLWDVATLDELARLYAVPGGSDWAVVSPEGLFDGSRRGRDKVTFRTGAGEVVPLDRFFEHGYHAGLLAALFRGERPLPEQLLPVSPAPAVKLLVNPGGSDQKERVLLDIAVTDRGGGARRPVVRHNGTPLPFAARGEADGKTTRYRMPAALLAGDNTFDVRATTANGVLESERAVASLRFEGALPPPDLYLLALGINRYDAGWRPDYPDLFFAAADAEALAAAVAERARTTFRQVHVELLLNEQATRSRVLEAIKKIAQHARPQDVLLFFAACHGETVGQRFYLLQHDLSAAAGLAPTPRPQPRVIFGGRGALSPVEQKVQQHGLAIDELADALGGVAARRRILIFDTCSSGSVASLGDRQHNPFVFRGAVERLSHGQGVFCLAAAPVGAAAKEPQQLGHGVLTHTLLAGLGAAKAGPWQGQPVQDGGVYGWLQYARQRVPALYADRVLFGDAAMEQPVALSGADQPDFPLFSKQDARTP